MNTNNFRQNHPNTSRLILLSDMIQILGTDNTCVLYNKYVMHFFLARNKLYIFTMCLGGWLAQIFVKYPLPPFTIKLGRQAAETMVCGSKSPPQKKHTHTLLKQSYLYLFSSICKLRNF